MPAVAACGRACDGEASGASFTVLQARREGEARGAAGPEISPPSQKSQFARVCGQLRTSAAMVLPIEAYIDTCSRHNEQPHELIATALSSEASGGLRIANLKLVPPLTPRPCVRPRPDC